MWWGFFCWIRKLHMNKFMHNEQCSCTGAALAESKPEEFRMNHILTDNMSLSLLKPTLKARSAHLEVP